RPAAMTTAARSFVAIRAGAPGFEPGIAGPKPAALPLGYAPSTVFSTKCRSRSADAAGRRPRRQSRHGLDGRRRKRRLSSWLRPIKPFSLQSVAAEVPTLPDGARAGKADTALTAGAATGASALAY